MFLARFFRVPEFVTTFPSALPDTSASKNMSQRKTAGRVFDLLSGSLGRA
jgi:hypothetical protein